MTAPFRVLLLAVVVTVCAGCRYSFTGGSVPSHLKTVTIPVTADQSGFGDPTLRQTMTSKLTERFINDNTLRVVDRQGADCMLETTITTVSQAPVSVQAGETISKYRITVAVRAVFTDLKQRKKMWEKSLSNYGEYTASEGLAGRTNGLNEAVRKLTEDILLETVSGW